MMPLPCSLKAYRAEDMPTRGGTGETRAFTALSTVVQHTNITMLGWKKCFKSTSVRQGFCFTHQPTREQRRFCWKVK
jgi:hypothetical protein